MLLEIYNNSKAEEKSVIEELIGKLTSKYNIGIIQYTHVEVPSSFKNLEINRYMDAGAKVIAVSANAYGSFVFKDNLNLDEITKKLTEIMDLDIILIEDYKNKNNIKISIGSVEQRDKTSIQYDYNNLDKILDHIKNLVELEKIYQALPKLDCAKCGYDCKKMAELIYQGDKSFKDCIVLQTKDDEFVLEVNGISIPVGEFVTKFFKNTILGMVSVLKGVEQPQEIAIKLRCK